MDPIFGLLAIAVLGFVFVAPLVAIVRSRSLSQKVESQGIENEALRREVRALTARIYNLEKTIEKIGAKEREEKTPSQPVNAVAEAVKTAEPVPTPVSLEPLPSQHIVSEAGQELLTEEVAAIPALSSESLPLKKDPAPQPSITTARGSEYIPAFARTEEKKIEEKRSWADIEEKLGANWLNKIGTAAFVIGVALLLNYSMHYLGARGKIGLGYFLAAILLVTGVIGEKKERYKIGARAVLGGGWALAYFTTYALHNIASVRLVANPGWGFALLFAAGVAMVAHSLRYHSEVTTGFAYLLGFASVAVSQIPTGALFASALLAASLAVVLHARRWFVVEPFAIAATYLVHWMWLQQIYKQIGGPKPFPQFPASVALLTLYWAIYLVSYFLREDSNERETQLLTASFLLNAAGYLVILHYQSFHPEWRFWFLLGSGAVYLGVSALAWKIKRRLGFILASTLGSALMIAAVPYRYSGGRLEILWLLEIEALLVTGWRLLDSHFRKLAWVGAAMLAGYVAFHDIWPRAEQWRPPDGKLGWLLLAIAVGFYVNTQLKGKLDEGQTGIDEVAFVVLPPISTAFVLSAAWVALPFSWTGLAWIAIGFVFVESGLRFRDTNLWVCGHVAMILAVARLLSVDLVHNTTWHSISLRLVTLGISAAILYVSSRSRSVRGTSPDSDTPAESIPEQIVRLGGLPALYTGAGTLLVALAILEEAASAGVGLGWGLFGLLLVETAVALTDQPLLVQGRCMLVASFIRIFIADLNSTSRIGPFLAPMLTVSLLAAIYYYVASCSSESPRIRSALLWAGTISVAALLRFVLPIEWVAVGWAIMAVACYAIGRYGRIQAFRNQSYVMTLMVGIRCAFDNFYQVGRWHFTDTRTVTVATCIVLLFAIFTAEQLAKRVPPEALFGEKAARQLSNWRKAWRAVEAHPQYLFFFVPIVLLTVLVSLEVRRGYLTAAWGIEGLIVFLAVLKMDERVYRWFSLLLFLLCIGRVITVDVWNLDALGRIVSFLGLGAASLAVSFLYARYREMLRRVL